MKTSVPTIDARPFPMPVQPETSDVFVCVDCGYYLANGPPDEPEPGWSPDQLDTRWQGYHLVNGDSEKDHDFSWTPCEGCGSPLGGTRMHCVAWERTEQ